MTAIFVFWGLIVLVVVLCVVILWLNLSIRRTKADIAVVQRAWRLDGGLREKLRQKNADLRSMMDFTAKERRDLAAEIIELDRKQMKLRELVQKSDIETLRNMIEGRK